MMVAKPGMFSDHVQTLFYFFYRDWSSISAHIRDCNKWMRTEIEDSPVPSPAVSVTLRRSLMNVSRTSGGLEERKRSRE